MNLDETGAAVVDLLLPHLPRQSVPGAVAVPCRALERTGASAANGAEHLSGGEDWGTGATG